MKPLKMYMAVHEAAHGVVAISLGGYAEEISILPDGAREGYCHVSWPNDGADRRDEKLIVLAAGAAAVSLYRKQGLDLAILDSGYGDLLRMKELGDTSDHWFKTAKRICRTFWPEIMRVARGALATGTLREIEIDEAMEAAA